MKIEKLSANCYRVRQQYKGQRYTVMFDHKPNAKEVNIAMAEKLQYYDPSSKRNLTFEKALDLYIESKNNILSPSTISGYKTQKNTYSDNFKKLNIYEIMQEDVQREVNRYAEKHSPKSVKNFHGLISAVMKYNRPGFALHTTLPEQVEADFHIPSNQDVDKILEKAKGTPYSVALQLACLGLRRSEICALELSDIEGNYLHINKAKVINDSKEYVKKPTKTKSGKRTIYIPDSLVAEIKQQGCIYDGHPGCILRELNRIQDELGMQRCKLHELRHFYVSYAHNQGMSDADIIASIGHKTDKIMKRVYLHAMEVEKEQKRIASLIIK